MASIKLVQPIDDEDVVESEQPEAIADPAEADETESVAVEKQSTVPRRKWMVRPRAAALTLVVLALAGLAGFFGWHYVQAQRVATASAAALRTANSYAVTLTSVDTNSLDANFAAVLDGATGEFRDMYAKSSSELRTLLIAHKATGHGVVIDSAVKSATPDQVLVLLFVDQTVSNTEVPDPRVDRSRIAMTMQKVDGRWKAAKVDLP